MISDLNDIIKSLPDEPGVYQFYNEKEDILYVGKAKNLKKRVSSYFFRDHDNRKIEVLVSKIAAIRYIVVGNEQEALLLENTLIKKHQPRYNVLLKDDKTFPWICIKNEPFPRIFLTRNYIQDGSVYYGPYTSVYIVRTLLQLIKELFPLRNCSLDLSEEKNKPGKYTSCLEYHLGNCKAPCIFKQSQEEYNLNISQIKNILKGNINKVISYLNDIINSLSVQYKFEEAHLVKEKLDIIERYRSKSIVVNPAIHDVDVFSYLDREKVAFVNYMKILDGCIVQVHTMELRKRLDETKEELLELALSEIRQKLGSVSCEIIIPFPIELEMPGVQFIVPQKGDKLKLLEMSLRNARHFATEAYISETKIRPKRGVDTLLLQMKQDLRLRELPRFIECFDNSNLQGTNPVASCVVFKDAKPLKSEYKHYNIKTVEGPDDFASMEEIIYRRYRRLLDELKPLPQLIVIDGGKGQLHAALNSLNKLEITDKVNIISIAKKLEEIYVPGDSVPLYIDKNSSTLKVIQNLRNEAHRFGINFHKLKRSNSMIVSELDEIKGIGEKTKQQIFQHFKSLDNLQNRPFEELKEVLGKSKALLVKSYFDKKNK